MLRKLGWLCINSPQKVIFDLAAAAASFSEMGYVTKILYIRLLTDTLDGQQCFNLYSQYISINYVVCKMSRCHFTFHRLRGCLDPEPSNRRLDNWQAAMSLD